MSPRTQRPGRNIPSLAAAFVLAASFTTSTLFAQNTHGKASPALQNKTGVTLPKPESTVLPDGRVIFNVAEQMPEYSGDMQAFLVANIRYPAEARKKNIQGRSVVRFIVTSDGRISDAEIIRSSGNKLLDDESLRVVGLMKEWKPGVKDGYPVAVFFHLPISYKLD